MYFEDEVKTIERWMDEPRFAETTRLYTARQVAEQRGAVAQDYTVAREAAAAFHAHLRDLFAQGLSITLVACTGAGGALATPGAPTTYRWYAGDLRQEFQGTQGRRQRWNVQSRCQPSSGTTTGSAPRERCASIQRASSPIVIPCRTGSG